MPIGGGFAPSSHGMNFVGRSADQQAGRLINAATTSGGLRLLAEDIRRDVRIMARQAAQNTRRVRSNLSYFGGQAAGAAASGYGSVVAAGTAAGRGVVGFNKAQGKLYGGILGGANAGLSATARGGAAAAGFLAGGVSNAFGALGTVGKVALAIGGARAASVGLDLYGRGLVSAQRGGSFGAGFNAAFEDLYARIPVIGESQGFAPASRVRQGATGSLNAATAIVDRLAGPDAISDGARRLLARVETQRSRNEELGRQRNQALVEQNTINGFGLTVEALGRLVDSRLEGAFGVRLFS